MCHASTRRSCGLPRPSVPIDNFDQRKAGMYRSPPAAAAGALPYLKGQAQCGGSYTESGGYCVPKNERIRADGLQATRRAMPLRLVRQRRQCL